MAISIGTTSLTTGIGSSENRTIFKSADGILIQLMCNSSTSAAYKISSDNGATWSASWTTISDGFSALNKITGWQDTNDNIYVTYNGTHSSSGGTIGFVKLTYASSTWSAGTQVVKKVGYNPAYHPTITKTTDGNLYIVGNYNKTGYGTLYTWESTDDGATWSLNGTSFASSRSACAIPKGSDLWIIDQKLGTLVLHVLSSGSWTTSTIVASGVTNDNYNTGVLKISDTEIYATTLTSSGVTLYKYNGTSWDSGTVITSATNDSRAVITQFNTQPCVLWTYNDGTYNNIAYKTYDGSSWSSQQALTNNTSNNTMPCVLALSGTVVGSSYYTGSSSPYTIYYATITNAVTRNSTLNSNMVIKKVAITNTIYSNSKIIASRNQNSIDSNMTIKRVMQNNITSNTVLKRVGEVSTILSNLKIIVARVQDTLNSNMHIKKLGAQSTLNSSMSIKKSGLQNTTTSDMAIIKTRTSTTTSDMTISRVGMQSTIQSNMRILWDNVQRTIDSNMKIVKRVQNNIYSNSKIILRGSEDITSNMKIRGMKKFYAKTSIINSASKNFTIQATVTQSTALDPTGVSVVDLQLGDAVEIKWTDSGNYGYNVYKEVGGTWVLQNPIVLIGATSFIVGGLVTNVTYTFKITGVNGVGAESTGEQVLGTPTYSLNKYSTAPSYQLYIDDVLQSDIILDAIELVYSPGYHTATWHINTRPDTVGLPVPNRQIVTVFINSRKVFTGYLLKCEGRWTPSDISVHYVAQGKSWEYTWTTGSSRFREFHDSEIDYDLLSIPGNNYGNKRFLIYLGLPVTGLPASYLDSNIDTKDMTLLDIMNNIGTQAGGYKVHEDFNGLVSFYNEQVPLYTRTYEIGKNILSYTDTVDQAAVVTGISVSSALTEKTVSEAMNSGFCIKNVFNPGLETAPIILPGDNWTEHQNWTAHEMFCKDMSGKYYKTGSVSVIGKILDIQAFGKANEKPEVLEPVTYVLREGEDPIEIEVFPTNTTPVAGIPAGQWGNGGTEARKALSVSKEYTPTWKALGITWERWGGKGSAHFKVEVPIVYTPTTRSGTADVYTIDPATKKSLKYTYYVDVLDEPIETCGEIMLVITYEQDTRSSATYGSGPIWRTYHEEGIKPYTQLVGGPFSINENNSSAVNAYINRKATEYFAQYKSNVYQGQMTILGDETLDLRTTINGKLVQRIKHDFSQGYKTIIDLGTLNTVSSNVSFKGKDKKQLVLASGKSNSFVSKIWYPTRTSKTGIFQKELVQIPLNSKGSSVRTGTAHYAD